MTATNGILARRRPQNHPTGTKSMGPNERCPILRRLARVGPENKRQPTMHSLSLARRSAFSDTLRKGRAYLCARSACPDSLSRASTL